MSRAKADGLFFAARKLEEEGKIMEALQKYDEIHSIDRMYDKAWFYKFKLLFQLGHTEKAAICAQNAVTLKPKWVRRIREVEAEVRIAHNQQYVEIPLVVPKSKAEEKRRQAQSSAMLFGILDNIATTVDGTSAAEANGGSLAYIKIGQMTQHLDGKGPHRILDPDTKEEWIIERKDIDIVTHAHSGPKKLKDKSLLEGSEEERLMLALVKLARTKRAYNKVSQEELQEILQRKAQNSSEEEPPEYSRSRSRSK